jgi:hypothetical protein
LHEGRAGDARVRRAIVGADLAQAPAWCVRAQLDDGTTVRAQLVDFRAAALLAPPTSDDDVESFDARLGEQVDADVQIAPLPGGWAYRLSIDAADGQPLLRAGASFEPIVLPDPSHVRRLYYGADADGLFLGRRDGRWIVDTTSDALADPRPIARPDPRPEAAALLQALVTDDLLALRADPDRDLLWSIEVAIFGPPSVAQAATALEELLLDHDAVDELFADTEQLENRIATIRG